MGQRRVPRCLCRGVCALALIPLTQPALILPPLQGLEPDYAQLPELVGSNVRVAKFQVGWLLAFVELFIFVRVLQLAGSNMRGLSSRCRCVGVGVVLVALLVCCARACVVGSSVWVCGGGTCVSHESSADGLV